MKNFIDTADSRKTSTELMEAIFYTSGKSEKLAERIWAEPTNDELIAIWERVTKNGNIESTDFCWGAAGSRWAANVENA